MPALEKPRHELFCQQYVIDHVASAAYKRAGYKAEGNAAEVNAHKLLRNAKVAARVQELEAEAAARNALTKDEVIEKLRQIADADLGRVARWTSSTLQLFNSDDLDPEVRKNVKKVTVRKDGSMSIEQVERLPAIVKLGEAVGLFKQEVDHNHKGKVVVVVESLDNFTGSEDLPKKPQPEGVTP